MLRVRKTAKSGIHGNNVLLSLVGQDKKLHKILLPPAAAVQAAVSILGTVTELPEGDALTQAQWVSVMEMLFRCLGT